MRAGVAGNEAVATDESYRPRVGSHYLSFLEQVRELLVQYLREDRLSADRQAMLRQLLQSRTFAELAQASHSPLETAFYLLRVGTLSFQQAADGHHEVALEALLAGLDAVEGVNGSQDPFDGLLYALAARLAERLRRDELRARLTERVEWFAEQDEDKAGRLRWFLDELRDGSVGDASE